MLIQAKNASFNSFCKLRCNSELKHHLVGIQECVKHCTKNTADLVTFSEEILNGKFYFLCSESVH